MYSRQLMPYQRGFASKNSITPFLAFSTKAVFVLIFIPSAAGIAQDATIPDARTFMFVAASKALIFGIKSSTINSFLAEVFTIDFLRYIIVRIALESLL